MSSYQQEALEAFNNLYGMPANARETQILEKISQGRIPDGMLRGRVVSPQGIVFKVALYPEKDPNDLFPNPNHEGFKVKGQLSRLRAHRAGEAVSLGKDGFFEFRRLPDGVYFLGLVVDPKKFPEKDEDVLVNFPDRKLVVSAGHPVVNAGTISLKFK